MVSSPLYQMYLKLPALMQEGIPLEEARRAQENLVSLFYPKKSYLDFALNSLLLF